MLSNPTRAKSTCAGLVLVERSKGPCSAQGERRAAVERGLTHIAKVPRDVRARTVSCPLRFRSDQGGAAAGLFRYFSRGRIAVFLTRERSAGPQGLDGLRLNVTYLDQNAIVLA